MTAETRSVVSVNEAVVFVACEIGKKFWTLAMTSGLGVEPVVRTVEAADWQAVGKVLAEGRRRLRVTDTARVVSCYEAGRDGFWIHRALVAQGVESHVVDSSSIEVNRRARRSKTDRLDACKLVHMLVRFCLGEKTVWRTVRVPTEAQEAARQVSRERTALTQEQTRLINQLRGWLMTCGTTLPKHRGRSWWAQVRDWSGRSLSRELQARLARASSRLALVAEQIAVLDAQQVAAVRAAAPESPAARLVEMKGVAETSVSILLDEGLVWRAFRNRRELGGLLGFTPTPYDSGDSKREQGISGAGNARLQSVAIQLAWNWVRWQKQSALTQWYLARFGSGKRARRIGIVALARKLMIALWRYATVGVVPAGAILKAKIA